MSPDEARFCTLCHQVFNTPTGKELMTFLDTILISPVANPQRDANFAFHREGENNLIRRLKAGMMLHETRDATKERDKNETNN